MKKFSFKCTCGDVITVDDETREGAVAKIKEMMNEEALAKHMTEKHLGEPVPSVEENMALIEQNVYEETPAEPVMA